MIAEDGFEDVKCECRKGDICEHHGVAMFHGDRCP